MANAGIFANARSRSRLTRISHGRASFAVCPPADCMPCRLSARPSVNVVMSAAGHWLAFAVYIKFFALFYVLSPVAFSALKAGQL